MSFRGNLRPYEKHQENVPILKGTLHTFGPWKFEGIERKTLFTYNNGASALDRGVVMVSADGNIWGTLSATTFNTLGSASVGRDAFLDTSKWWKLNVACTGGTAQFSYWWGF